MKKFAGSLIVSLVATVFTLVIIELGFRALGVGQMMAKPRHDRPRLYFLPEDSSTLQDRHYEAKKPPETFRISVVGDSFTFGPYLQFDDTFPKRLERWLNLNRNQPKVEVINRGFSGFSTKDQLPQVLKAIEAGSDLIVLEITLNDAELDPLNLNNVAIENRYHFGKYKRPQGILRHWKSLIFLLERMHNSSTHEDYKRYFHNLFYEEASWHPFATSLSQICKLAKAKGVPLVAVIFPIFTFPIDKSYPFNDIHERIGELLTARGVSYLDLREAYRGIPPDRLQVWPGKDTHPGELAHRIAAEQLYIWLMKNRAVPEEAIARHITRRRQDHKYPFLKPKQIERFLKKQS